MSKFDPTVAVVGRIGTDPEVKESARGSYVSFRLARDFTDMEGKTRYTKWYTVTLDTDTIPASVAKGKTVEVRGSQSVRPGVGKDGEQSDMYTIRSTVNDIAAPRMGKNGSPLESFVISGRVGREPETLVAKSGRVYHKLSLAHNYSVRNEDGEWTDYPVWYNVALFTDDIPEFVQKGALVEVRGVDEVSTYVSKKHEKLMESCSIRAFEISMPDNSKAATRGVAVNSGGADSPAESSFEAPF